MKTVTMMSGPAIRKLRDENARLREARARLRRLVVTGRALSGMFDYTSNPEDWRKEIRAFELALAAAGEMVSVTAPSRSETSYSDG